MHAVWLLKPAGYDWDVSAAADLRWPASAAAGAAVTGPAPVARLLRPGNAAGN